MKKWLLFCFLLPFCLFGEINDDGDFQIWNTDGIDIRLSPKSSFYGDIEFRYGDDAKKLYYKHIHLELNWNLNRHVILTPGFRFIWFRINNKWVKENDPLLKLTLFFLNSRQVVITDRNWVQYRNLPDEFGGKHRFLYRNRIQFLFPWQFGSNQINPYFSNEIFWQEAWGIFENRAIAGVMIPRSSRAFFDFFYMYRSLKNLQKTWVQNNVFGAGVHFHF